MSSRESAKRENPATHRQKNTSPLGSGCNNVASLYQSSCIRLLLRGLFPTLATKRSSDSIAGNKMGTPNAQPFCRNAREGVRVRAGD